MVNYPLLKLTKRDVVSLGIVAFLLASLGVGLVLTQKIQIFNPRAATTPFDFYGSDLKVLKFFGQKGIGENSRGKVGPFGIDHSSGVIVDKSTSPNKLYVVDTGNNRVLGYNGTGKCVGNSSLSCTTDSDCNGVGGNSCYMDGTKAPDIVFGQPDIESGACNGDNNLGFNKSPTASLLCLIDYPARTNTAEYWMRTNIDVDSEGNLYVPDVYNNRVLKYDQPLSADKSNGKGDNVADFEIGQDSLETNGRNKGSNYDDYTTHSSNSLWISSGPPDHVASRGVSIDIQDNVWVADTFNGRVLRFPKDSQTADLVLGQDNFSNRYKGNCYLNVGASTQQLPNNLPRNRFCSPTLAKVDPDTGDLYVIDEYPQAFRARILVFRPNFTNGMQAYKELTPLGGSDYIFRTTGFAFNTYKVGDYTSGKLWINDGMDRTILTDSDGNIIKVLGAIDQNHAGGDRSGYDAACGSIYDEGFNLWKPGGSIGFDQDNNIYLADEFFNRVSRYKVPFETRTINDKTCFPLPSGGLFPGQGPNVPDDSRLGGGSTGTVVYQNQLILADGGRLLVWNNYQDKSFDAPPDITINARLPRVWLSQAIDDRGRLWVFNDQGKIRVYQLPFVQGENSPIAENIPLYWQDDGSAVSYFSMGTSVSYSWQERALYVVDGANHRILRVKNYDDLGEPGAKLLVDMVIGQRNKSETMCNHDQIEVGSWSPSGSPTAESLCSPTQASFDNFGNLYVVENRYECHGNNRITTFMYEDLANAQGLFPNIEAEKVFNKNSLTEQAMPGCNDGKFDQPGSPVSIAFDSANHMVVGNDGYFADVQTRQNKQLWFYQDPLSKQTPDAAVQLPMGAG